MPALPTVVSTYIDNITDSLKVGSDLGQNLRAAGRNYLRAQDLATILELLQDATGSATLTATAGSTTTATVASIPANSYVGALVTFAANTTTVALRGVTTRVLSHTTTVFTFTTTLEAAVAVGDTFTVKHDFLNASISEIRQGKAKGENPPGNVYGMNRTAMDAMQKLLSKLGSTLPETNISHSGAQVAAGCTDTVLKTKDTYRIDEFKGLTINISSQDRTIVSNTENTVVLNKALSSAPAADTAYTVKRQLQAAPIQAHITHPGGHPDNAHLANAIALCKTVVAALVLPT